MKVSSVSCSECDANVSAAGESTKDLFGLIWGKQTLMFAEGLSVCPIY